MLSALAQAFPEKVPEVLEAVFDLPGDQPTLVYWRAGPSDDANDADESTESPHAWQDLVDHRCAGLAKEAFCGQVISLEVANLHLRLLMDIAMEEFAAECRITDLDAGVTTEHRESYGQYLEQRGLQAGDLALLRQGVYPLALNQHNLTALGIKQEATPGLKLLLLGWNCA